MNSVMYDVGLLEKGLSTTISRRYSPIFSKKIFSSIKKSNENNFVLDNIESIGIPEYQQELIGLYNSKFSLNYSYIIPNNIKLVQGLMMDSLVFGYDMETDEINLYTMNVSTLFNLGVDMPKLLDTCFNYNTEGKIYAFRIDAEYTSENQISFKAVRLISKKSLVVDKFCFFPYEIISSAMGVIKRCMDMGVTFRMVQNFPDGLKKERFVSASEKILSMYCDNKEATRWVRASYFPIKAFMYLPVLGAPSTSSMVTRVNLFNLDAICPVTSKEQLKVEKIKNPLESLILRSSISTRLAELQLAGGWDYMEAVESIPNIDKYFNSDSDKYLVPSYVLNQVLSSLSIEEQHRVCEDIGASDIYDTMSSMLTENRVIDISRMDEMALRRMLHKGIYNVISISKKCKYYSMIVTNSREILAKMYGEDYFARCEAYNVRWYELCKRIKAEKDIESSLKYCGFPVTEDTIAFCKEYKDVMTSEQEAPSSTFSEIAGQEWKRVPSTTESILCRSCFSALEYDGKISNYYEYFVKSAVVRVIKLG